MDRRCESLRNTPPLRTALNLAKLGAYSVLLRPGWYGLVRNLPGLGLGRTVYDESYPLQRYSRVLAGFAQTLFERLHSLSERRRANAAALLEVLREINGVRVIEPSPDSQPAFVRLPFLVDDPARRSTVIERLDRAGIGATASYPSALCDVPEIAGVLPASDRTMPGAQRVARSIVTLPTHPYCPPELPRRVADVLRRSLR
jgi:dTDP-4-amino-4,6-dideoxygalactose transaminase